MTPMSLTELRSALHVLGLTQKDFAELIGYSVAQTNAICCGRTKIPRAVDLLVRLLLVSPETLDLLLEWIHKEKAAPKLHEHNNGCHR